MALCRIRAKVSIVGDFSSFCTHLLMATSVSMIKINSTQNDDGIADSDVVLGIEMTIAAIVYH